jgi:uncharacterized RDD family membrane protein YckC
MAEPPYGQNPQAPGGPQYPPPPPGGQQPFPYGTPPAPYGPPPGYGYPQHGNTGYGPPGFGGPRLANWGQRVGAYLLDAIIPLPLVIIAGILIVATSTPDTITYDAGGNTVVTPGSGPGAAVLSIALLLYLASLAVTIYNRWVRQGRTGQSWGKQVVKLRLLSESTGQPIGGGMAFVRDLAHILDSLALYLGWLWPLWDAKRQTFADKVVKTVVTAEG